MIWPHSGLRMGGYADFIRASSYTRAVDRKKLGFLYSHAIAEAERTGRLCADMRALDLGAGSGAVTLPLATLFGHVDAVDIDTEALARLRSRSAELGRTNVAVFEGDAAAFCDVAPYDVVLASDMIQHVPDTEALLATIVSLVRPGGLLLATIANGYGPFEMRNWHLNPRARLVRVRWIRRLLGKAPYRAGGDVAHFFTFRQIVDRFREHGFALVEARNSDWLLPLVGSLPGTRLGELDCRLADRVPPAMASGWYFALRRAARGARIEPTPTSSA